MLPPLPKMVTSQKQVPLHILHRPRMKTRSRGETPVTPPWEKREPFHQRRGGPGRRRNPRAPAGDLKGSVAVVLRLRVRQVHVVGGLLSGDGRQGLHDAAGKRAVQSHRPGPLAGAVARGGGGRLPLTPPIPSTGVRRGGCTGPATSGSGCLRRRGGVGHGRCHQTEPGGTVRQNLH